MNKAIRNKELYLLGCAVFFGVVFWLSTITFLRMPDWAPSPFLWSAGVSLVALIALWTIVIVAAESLFAVTIAWAIISYTGVIWMRDVVFIGAASLLFVFGLIAYVRARAVMHKTYNGGLIRPLRKGVPLTITFIAAAVASAGYLIAPAVSLDIETVLPEWAFASGLSYLEPGIRAISPGFKSTETLEEYILQETAKKADKDVSALRPAEREEIVALSLQKFEEEYNMKLDRQETLGHVLYRAVVGLVRRQIVAYQTIFPVAYSVGFFVALRVLFIPLYWVAIGIGLLLLKLGVRFGIIEPRVIPTEVIAYSMA